MTDDDLLPAMPDFDPKATRRAVRRGVARTAITVLAALLVLVLAATVGSGLIQRRGDREQHMTDVLGTAFKIYNPGYDVEIRERGATTPLSMSFTVAVRPIRAVGGSLRVTSAWSMSSPRISSATWAGCRSATTPAPR